jgi:hypothetical protein
MQNESGSEYRREPPAVRRGYVLTYRAGRPHPCPGCGGTNWNVGRQTAECAHCLTALPLGDAGLRRPWTPGWRPATNFA